MMASSAFRSTSRRGNASSSEKSSPKKVPIRRSHSVSAVPRAHSHHLDIASEYLNKRDNPLFWSTTAEDKPIETEVEAATDKQIDDKTQRPRGRSVTRRTTHPTVNQNVPAASAAISRRHRSVSRGHYAASESEVERDSAISSNYRNKSSSTVAGKTLDKANLHRNATDVSRKSAESRAFEPSDNSSSCSQIPYLEDGISMASLSGAEERTINAVCEQMKSFQGDVQGGADAAASGIYETVRSEVRRAISDMQNDIENAMRRNNATANLSSSVADVPPDLVNPGAVELLLDIRREYARKLEESQERATKLRADLAVEEHRGQELNRILKELLPDPKISNRQKSRVGRKNSSERKKMSKRLTEEAMAYFDECVSISTFDSSDFSAPEDLPLNLIGATTTVGGGGGGAASLAQGSPSIWSSCSLNSHPNHKQESASCDLFVHSRLDSGLTATSSSNEPSKNQASVGGNAAEWGRRLQFSYSHKPAKNVGLQEDVRNYVKAIGKDDSNSDKSTSIYFDLEEYLHGQAECFLFDRVLFSNRTDSGSLHLCGGGLPLSFSPFSSVI
ncbi:uncharacterized protein LOC127801280 isoform X2 [Diospyros lotus]|uniref:uncharacterized protein LOC127801280 isoform X2 n=1 Tax=Diospyros lotus TaxID=55363 RepID=UPI0022562091|nr:uncharacterized protein LOC127801280 isoform X2 [Diospyros lotus]